MPITEVQRASLAMALSAAAQHASASNMTAATLTIGIALRLLDTHAKSENAPAVAAENAEALKAISKVLERTLTRAINEAVLIQPSNIHQAVAHALLRSSAEHEPLPPTLSCGPLSHGPMLQILDDALADHMHLQEHSFCDVP